MSGPLFTPAQLRELAEAELSVTRPFLMDEFRRAIRWAANVIEAADVVIREAEECQKSQPR